MFEFPCIISLRYIKNQQKQLWQYCLLVTARSLYMFRTLSASIIRSTKNCNNSLTVLNRLRHSAEGNRPWTSLLDTHHPDPRHALVAAPTVLVLLVMDAESVRNMLSDLAVANKQYCQSCILLVLYMLI